MLERQPGETKLQFHKRLVFGKLVDKTLADIDYGELAPLLYGQEYAGDNARKMMYGSLRTLELMDAEGVDMQCGNGCGDVVDSRIADLKIEQQKFFDQRAAFNKTVRERARQIELNDLITSTVKESVENGTLPKLKYEPALISYSDRDLLVSLNDIHYGAVVDNFWHKYDSTICQEMFSKYLAKVIQIGEETNAENCIVWCNGDEISGNIHYSIAVTNKENVIQQVMGVSELISNFIAELSKHFRTVSFVSIPGNHSRVNPDKNVSLNSERLDDLVEWYMKARLQDFDNVTVGAGVRVDPTMYMIDIRGKRYVGVHGDFDGSDAKVQSVKAMIERAGQPVYAVLSGHLHHNKIDSVQGVKTVMAGSFLGMDDYCVSRRILGAPEQLVCVVTDGGIECSYDVAL